MDKASLLTLASDEDVAVPDAVFLAFAGSVCSMCALPGERFSKPIFGRLARWRIGRSATTRPPRPKV